MRFQNPSAVYARTGNWDHVLADMAQSIQNLEGARGASQSLGRNAGHTGGKKVVWKQRRAESLDVKVHDNCRLWAEDNILRITSLIWYSLCRWAFLLHTDIVVSATIIMLGGEGCFWRHAGSITWNGFKYLYSPFSTSQTSSLGTSSRRRLFVTSSIHVGPPLFCWSFGGGSLGRQKRLLRRALARASHSSGEHWQNSGYR